MNTLIEVAFYEPSTVLASTDVHRLMANLLVRIRVRLGVKD